MHDPSQFFPTVGAYSGMMTPSGLPYTALQAASLNPAAAFNPLAATLGVSQISPGGIPQLGQPYGAPYNVGLHQLQTAAILAAQAATNPQLLGLSPWATGIHNPLQAALIGNPMLQNPLINPGLHNPFIHNPYINGPFLNGGLQNPLLQNPLFSPGMHNPFQAALLGNPLVGGAFANPFFGGFQNPWQQGGLYGYQQHSPYSQIGHIGSQLGQIGGQSSPFAGQPGQASPYGQPSPYGQIGYPLAPQSWVGQAGPYGGQPFGQVHPLFQQIGVRPYQAPGIGPWGQ